jgi:pyrophosphatase PpaX
MKKLNDYDLYLFDVDGTLIDTGELIFQCYKETCLKYGSYHVPRSEITRYMGIPLKKMTAALLPDINNEALDMAVEFYINHQREIYSEYLALFPGVKETLYQLKEKGKPLGIVTSRTSDSLDKYLDLLEIAPFFDFTITPDDTEEHKPHPEPVHKAMEKAAYLTGNETPFISESVLFVGDAEFDIQSGNRAGTHTALVLWGHNGPDDIESRPTHLLREMSQLL